MTNCCMVDLVYTNGRFSGAAGLRAYWSVGGSNDASNARWETTTGLRTLADESRVDFEIYQGITIVNFDVEHAQRDESENA